MAVTISGMFGDGHTYFSGSPVVISVSGLEWPEASPFKVVRLNVLYDENAESDSSSSSSSSSSDSSSSDSYEDSVRVVGEFRVDTGGESTAVFDISSALRSIWAGYDFNGEVESAQYASEGNNAWFTRSMRKFSIAVYTEYIAADGSEEITYSGTFDGGQCIIGSFNEMERSNVDNPDVSVLERTNPRNGDASTKPVSSPEIIGENSITSWVDVSESGTKSIFYKASAEMKPDDIMNSSTGWTGHAPLVLRNDVKYTDFLFVNRRGAIETCSALMLESMDITVDTKSYARVRRPSFVPERALMAIAGGGRRSWSMSSGYQTREWAEWWTLEFLMAQQCWMLYNGKYYPVIVEPAKKSTGIYNKTKQEMPSVEFTVTLALEG